MKVARAIISIFITIPIWIYLVYKIMVAVNATELMWFLFWAYVPFNIIVLSLGLLITEEKQ